jgi:alcohol dehydrogenase
MKAAQISEYGGPEVIQIHSVEKLHPGAGQVLINVHASSVNPFDSKVRLGYMKEMRPLDFPSTVGGDVAGIVVEVGAGVTEFNGGDKVYGSAGVFGGGSGAMAEFAVTKSSQLGHMPKNTDFNEAAAVALVGLSAMQALIDEIGLTSGQSILIHGGSGGIGSAAIKLAKHLGAHVTTTVRGSSVAFARGLGADEVIDFEHQDFDKNVHNMDAVLDTVGGDTFTKSLAVLKKGGIAVSMAARADDALDKKYGVRSVGLYTKTSSELLDRLAKLVEQDAVKVPIDHRYPLDKTSQAFADFEKSHVRGKYVIEVA